MDLSTSRPSHRVPDLAEFVLADSRVADRRRPITTPGGHDVRSIAVLAIVVVTLAMVVAWTTTMGSRGSTPDAIRADAASVLDVEAVARTAATRDVTPVPVVGTDLQVGRIVTEASGSGGVLVRVGVRNAGTVALADATGAQLLVLVDGERAGSAAIGAIEADGAAIAVDVPLASCSTGAHPLVVVLDSGGVVREANERNNAQALGATFDC